MNQESSAKDIRRSGYITVFTGVLAAGMAVDRIFFHKAVGLRWLTAANALVCLVGGAWMIVKRRAPLEWMDGLAKAHWGPRGTCLVTVMFAGVAGAGIWLLSRLS